jgi:hypothetical protein
VTVDPEGADTQAEGVDDTELDDDSQTADETPTESAESQESESETTTQDADTGAEDTETAPQTLADHVTAVIDGDSERAVLLDDRLDTLAEVDADAVFEAIEDAGTVPHTVVVDGAVTQRILDVAAQRGVGQIVGASTGEFVKQPATVRVHTAADLDVET